jgi:hypothetical protein
MPRGKGPVNLPVIGPWQVMITMWVLRKVWDKYGGDVKSHLSNVNHPAARRIGDLIPAPNGSNHNATNLQATTATPSTTPASVSVPGQTADASFAGRFIAVGLARLAAIQSG